jgi:glycosyltransferase involved in cell wall biosynthesis
MSRILLVAPTIDRADVGEAWVAYQWADHLSARHDLTVLTYRKRNSLAVAEQLPNANVVEWREPPLLGKAERLNSLLKPGYFPFAARARRWIKNAIAHQHFDIAHQPLPVAMRYPSPLAGLPIPYVIGPVGGSLDTPDSFRTTDTAPWYVRLRKFDSFRLKFDLMMRATYRDAACVLGIAPYVGDLLQNVPTRRIEYLSETGLVQLPEVIQRDREDTDIRILFVGRVIRTKGVRDLVCALSHVHNQRVTADIVGSGFDLQNCIDRAAELNLSDRITFHGAVPREKVDTFYRSADIFVFPSYREPGGNAVFEAMGHGLPLIVCGRGGPSAAVDDSCAISIPVSTPEQYAHDIAAAITKLARDTNLRRDMGRAARHRVQKVGMWSSKIARVEEIYADVIKSYSES